MTTSWARRLKRVFGIEIEEAEVIAKTLLHLQRTAPDQYPTGLPLGPRALPLQSSLL